MTDRLHSRSSNPSFLSHRTPQVLACIFAVLTLVSIPVSIGTMDICSRSQCGFRTIVINTLQNCALIYALIECVSGVRFVHGRRGLDLGFEFLQRWGVLCWLLCVVAYIYVVADLGIRVHEEGHPTNVAALVFACFQLTTLLVGLVVRGWKFTVEEGGTKSIDHDVPPAKPVDYGSASGTLFVQVDPNGVNDDEERRRLI
ncbi:hypothetical protein EDC01DRAFT_629150 [Geopyxis carbonaria]|nr:hypothetical protein EDC01DRAFT_629150 [Geopyxis carbonaria]